MADFVRVPEADWQDILDATREKTGGTEKLLSGAVAPAVRGIETGGGGGENSLDYAVGIPYMFYGAILPDGTALDISFGDKATMQTGVTNTNVFYNTFYQCISVKSVKISSKLAFLKPYSMSYGFAQASSIETIDLTGMPQPLVVSAIDRCFIGCGVLKEILGELDVSNCANFNNTFANNYVLETVRFKAGTINKSLIIRNTDALTDETIQNIIDGLADLTDGTAQTLTLHATVGAKLTDAQKASASAKNWTISY